MIGQIKHACLQGSVLNSGLSQDEEDQLIIQSLTKEIDIDMLNEPPTEPSKTPEVSFEYSSSYKDVVWGKALLDPLAEQQNPGG